MSDHGRVEAIWIKRMKRGPMQPLDTARFVSDRGIVENADQGGRRQVTVIEQEVFDRIRATLPDAVPAMRRANLMVSGVRLEGSRGRVLSVGDVRILIQGETRPCHRMDEQCPGLTAALSASWNGGAYGTVLEGGAVHVGDPVSLGEATP